MIALKYKVIKSERQYKTYSRILEELLRAEFKGRDEKDEIELLTLLLERWDEQNNAFNDVDPVTLLKSLKEERNMKAKDLAELLDVSKGLVSDTLNRKKGMSKDIIRKLATCFSVAREAFNPVS